MPSILHRLPIRIEDDVLFVRDEMVRVKAYEIVAWVSLTSVNVLEFDPRLPRIPVLIDTANTHNFCLQERHLVHWAGLRTENLPVLGAVREREVRAQLYAARVWIHPNLPGRRDRFSGQPPHSLVLPDGIAVYPSEAGRPRLPLLGLRAIIRNNLHFAVDGARQTASLRTQRKWWFFG